MKVYQENYMNFKVNYAFYEELLFFSFPKHVEFGIHFQLWSYKCQHLEVSVTGISPIHKYLFLILVKFYKLKFLKFYKQHRYQPWKVGMIFSYLYHSYILNDIYQSKPEIDSAIMQYI